MPLVFLLGKQKLQLEGKKNTRFILFLPTVKRFSLSSQVFFCGFGRSLFFYYINNKTNFALKPPLLLPCPTTSISLTALSFRLTRFFKLQIYIVPSYSSNFTFSDDHQWPNLAHFFDFFYPGCIDKVSGSLPFPPSFLYFANGLFFFFFWLWLYIG